MSKSRIIASLGLAVALFLSEVAAQADVADGLGLYVRPSRSIELGSNPPDWVFFSPFGNPPPPPSQSDILLTPHDPLTVLVPLFAHLPATGYFGTNWSQEGNTIRINAYFLMGGMTETLYGPHEYICPIGQLAAGTYRIEVNYFRWGTGDWDPELAADFLNAPASFSVAHGVPVYDLDVPGDGIEYGSEGAVLLQAREFTVVPEPASVLLLLTGALAMARRTRGQVRSV